MKLMGVTRGRHPHPNPLPSRERGLLQAESCRRIPETGQKCPELGFRNDICTWPVLPPVDGLYAPAGSNRVGSVTCVARDSRAVCTISRLNAASRSGPRVGSPQTCSIRAPFTTLGAPVVSARLNSAVMTATGMPAFSMRLAIVAPQRLQVPQVATSRAPSIFSARRYSAMSSPIRMESLTCVPTPDTLMATGWISATAPASSNWRVTSRGIT